MRARESHSAGVAALLPRAWLIRLLFVSTENLGSTELDARYAADYEEKPFEHNDPNFRGVQAGCASL